MTHRILTLLCLTLWLTSCAVAPKQTLPSSEAVKTPVTSANNLKNWDISGAIALKTEKDSGSANINWTQQGKTYHITLIGPIGSGSYELKGQPGRVELATSGGKHFYANTPEEILLQQTGWKLPISNLYFWIRGLPVPGLSAQKQWDADHRLSELKQLDWSIQYLRYTSVNGVTVPEKIFLNNTTLNVKIIISQWHF